jgi:hypothetical protein
VDKKETCVKVKQQKTKEMVTCPCRHGFRTYMNPLHTNSNITKTPLLGSFFTPNRPTNKQLARPVGWGAYLCDSNQTKRTFLRRKISNKRTLFSAENRQQTHPF